MQAVTIKLKGKSPLLTHNPASMLIKPDKAKKGATEYDPAEEAEKGAYRLESGACAIPGIAIRNSLINAASAWKPPGRKGTMKGILAHVEIAEEFVPLLKEDGKVMDSYVIDSRRAVVQRQGIIRSRPRFENWFVDFELIYDEQLIPNVDIIKDILNDAGQRIGIGDYRPHKGGWFGRFEVI